jgi:hypothetical protein
MTQREIEQIFMGLPEVHVQEVGTLWQIRIGNHVGAREDGMSLARDLRVLYEAEHSVVEEPEGNIE